MPPTERRSKPSIEARLLLHEGVHGSVANARSTWTRRRSWVVEVSDGACRGYGEASPLEGHSAETLAEVRQDLEGWLTSRPPFAVPAESAELEAWLKRQSVALRTASARFAVETALLDYWSRRLNVAAWQLFAPSPVASDLATSLVLDPFDEGMLEALERAFADGLRTIKLKVGRDFEREFACIRTLRTRWAPERLSIRLDANQAWTEQQASVYLERLEPYGIEYVEEPCERSAFLATRGVPIALDESLLNETPTAAWLEDRPQARVLVLKPMLLGGWVRCLAWAQVARQTGRSVVISHFFDGPIALSACAQLAFVVQTPERATGLGRHRGLSAWRARSAVPLEIGSARLRVPQASGVGATWTRRLSVIEAAAEAPQQTALVVGQREYRYTDLARAVTRTLAWLDEIGALAQGRSVNGPIAFVADPSLSVLCLFYACLERGLTVLPLHPRWSEQQREQALARFSPNVALDESLLERLAEVVELALHEPPSPQSVFDETPRSDEPDLEQDLAWLFTSGSEGPPRLARLSRRAFLASADANAMHLGWQSDDRWLLSLPLAHVGGLSVLTRCLIARRAVVLDEKGLTARRWAERVDRLRVTLLSLVPTQLSRLLEDADFTLPARVRAVLLGGARASRVLVARARDRRIPVLRTYGLTEACSQVATEPLTPEPLAEKVTEGLVGRPLFGVEVHIGPSGAIEIRGETLFSGYVGMENLGNAWLTTSDHGQLDERGLRVCGRLDSVIQSGGEKVLPEAVEAVIADHPAVRCVCVVGVTDATWGERVAALVEIRQPVPLEEIEDWARGRLAAYEQPKLWREVDALPLLPSGKVDRKAAALWASASR